MHDTKDVSNSSIVLKDSIKYLKDKGYIFKNFYDILEDKKHYQSVFLICIYYFNCNVATQSTCDVKGNISTGIIVLISYSFSKSAKSLIKVAGLQLI